MTLGRWLGLGCWLLCQAPAPAIDDKPTSSEQREGINEVPLNPLSDEQKKETEARALYAIGSAELDRSELHRAYATFQKALERKPTFLEVLKEMVPLALQLGKADEGIEYCRRALEIDPDDPKLLHLYASRIAEAGKSEEAAEKLTRASRIPGLLDSDPKMYLQIRADLVDQLTTLNRWEEIVTPLQELIKIGQEIDRHEVGEFVRKQLERRKIMDYEQLGRALGQLKRWDEAIEVLESGRKADGRGARLALPMAEILLERGDVAGAEKEINAYIALGSQNKVAYELLAKILEKQGRSSELVGRVADAIKTDPDNPILREFYVEQLIQAGDLEKAETAISAIEGRASVRDIKTKLYYKLQKYDKLLSALADSFRSQQRLSPVAAELLTEISKDPAVMPKLAEAAKAFDKNDPNAFFVYLILGEMASQAKATDISADSYRRCLELRPGVPFVYRALLSVLWEGKKYQELLEASKKAIDENPGSKVDFIEYHSRALDALGRTDEAVKYLEDFAQQSKQADDVVTARLAMARIYMQIEKYGEAIAACQGVIDDHPDNDQAPYAKYLMATILSQKGESEESERILLGLLDEGSGLNPSFLATINNDLGYTWAEQGKNLDRAEVMVRKALEQRPDEAAYLDSLGWVLFKKGKVEEAIESLKKASEDPDGQDSVIFDHLGDALIKAGNAVEARAAWTKALELLLDQRTEKQRTLRENLERKLKNLAPEPGGSSAPTDAGTTPAEGPSPAP